MIRADVSGSWRRDFSLALIPMGTPSSQENREENADICNFVYGKTFLVQNGSHANHVFGKRITWCRQFGMVWSIPAP